MDEADTAEAVEGRGLAGGANLGARRPVTLISAERWAELMTELGADVDPAARRANLMLSGIDLCESRGKRIRIGKVELLIVGETRPCERMDEALPGLQDAMRARWGGGAYAEVIRGGTIRRGDAVELFES